MNFLLAPYVAAVVLFVAELGGRLSQTRVGVPLRSPLALGALLLGTYAVQLGILRVAALSTLHYHGLALYGHPMPIPVIFPLFPHADAIEAAFLLIGAAQSLLLATLYRTHVPASVLVAGCAANLAISVAAPVLGSFDLYGYVHDALLGRAAYAPPAIPWTGEYRIFDLWWGKPTPTLYGPLWIPIVQLVMSLGSTLLTKMVAYRVFCALLFAALVALLRAQGQPQRIVAAVALNPALAFLTVANGHNDLLVLVFIVAGAILVRRSLALGVAMVVLAGLIKLPYALLGLPIFAAVKSRAARAVACAATVGLAVAFSLLGSGGQYVTALQQHAGTLNAGELAQGVLVLIAIVLLGIAVAGGRRYLTGIWFMPSFGSFRMPWTFPWYTLFAFPYALARRRVLRYLLISLPFVTALVTPELMQVWTFLFAIPAATVLSLNLRRGKPPAAA